MLQYLLFDLDGTLSDSSEGITKSVQYGLRSVGIEVENLEELLGFIGPPLDYSLKEFYQLDGEKSKLVIEKYRERYEQVGKFENLLYPGMAELLKDMKARGKHLAVASSKPEFFIRQILKHFQIEQYFDVVVGSGLDGSLGTKEAVIEEALRQLFGKESEALTKEQRKRTAMIGDRLYDVRGGKAYGLVTIGVEYGFAKEGELKEAKADYIVRTVEELHAFLLRGSKEADEARMKEYRKVLKKKKQREMALLKQKEREQQSLLKTSFKKAIDILFPMLLYFVIYDVAGFAVSLLVSVIGEKAGGSIYEGMLAHAGTVRGILIIVTLLITTAALYPYAKWEFFFRYRPLPLKKVSPDVEEESKGMQAAKSFGRGVVFVITAVSASLGMNYLFTLFQIAELSESFNAVAVRQSDMALLVGIILYGFVSPLAEEVLFRGLLYNRMKQYFPTTISMVLSAMFFGLYHGNLVQGPFAVILGFAIAGLYEWYGTWYVPVAFHGIVNLSSYLLFANMPQKSGEIGFISCAVFMTIWISGMVYIGKTKKNPKNQF